MHHYDIFEKFIDGSSRWRVCISGIYNTERKLQELAETSDNQFNAIYIPFRETSPFNFIEPRAAQQLESLKKTSGLK